MAETGTPADNWPIPAALENEQVPGEQPVTQDAPPIDDAPVPPLTAPEDTEGG